MRLRNKKTGQEGNFIINKDHFECVDLDCVPLYSSLSELINEWEDYKLAEPLIKDEKIRKAVRAWAEANELDKLSLANNGYEIYGGLDDTVMQFVGEPLPFDNTDKTYTIAELCGEEER